MLLILDLDVSVQKVTRHCLVVLPRKQWSKPIERGGVGRQMGVQRAAA